MKTNLVVLALDASGSMIPICQETEDAFRNMLRNLREQSRAHNQHTVVGIVGFNDRAFEILYPVDVDSINDHTFSYRPRGSTALFDGVKKAIDQIEDLISKNPIFSKGSDVAKLVLTYTDGGENASFLHNAASIKQIMAKLQAKGDWTFAFQMPPGTGRTFANGFGIPFENIREWEATAEGVQEAAITTTAAIQTFMDDRAKGALRSTSLYTPVTTDMSKVSASKIKTKLHDVSDRVRAYNVEKESVVKDFTEAKTKKPYVLGQTYYQLMKTEKIQPNKAILLVEKGKKAVWGGPEARSLIGLPPNEHAKVTPGNHAQYDIYIQSTSTNRKLPRGTRVLVDTKQTQSMTPTWEAPKSAQS